MNENFKQCIACHQFRVYAKNKTNMCHVCSFKKCLDNDKNDLSVQTIASKTTNSNITNNMTNIIINSIDTKL